MTRLPPVAGRELVAALGRRGFQVIRVKGSHHVLRHADGRMTVVPVHGKEEIGSGLLAKILRERDVSRGELHDLL